MNDRREPVILVIDDSEDDRWMIEKALRQSGFENLRFAGSGEEAMRLCEKETFALVVCDTMMPGIDGFETCRRLIAMPGFKSPVVIQTGQADAVDAAKARLAGARDYVVKTHDSSWLLESIQTLLNPTH